MEPTLQYPTPEQVERHMREARRLRSETVHELLKSAGMTLAAALGTRMPESRGDIVRQASRA
jgi:hypothetical protein